MFRRYNQAAGPAHYQNSPKCEFRGDIQGDVVSFL